MVLQVLHRVPSIKGTNSVLSSAFGRSRCAKHDLLAFNLASAAPSQRLPSRSTVLRQSLLLAFPAQMTAAAAQGQTTNAVVKLRNGAQIPAIGLGVFLAR